MNHREVEEKGMLFICGTPIGNLNDVSFRLLEVLQSVDYILAEDTRKIRKILSKYEIKKFKNQLLSYNDYSSFKKNEFILKNIKLGKNIALVSEAGMPAIQDPGYKIIKECIENYIKLTVIPGPNAALSALILSGFETDNFLFIGFLPKSESKRRKKLKELKELPYTLIFYESPFRAFNLLKMLLDEFGDRNCCLARELTKIYEEVLRGKISELIELLTRQVKKVDKKGKSILVLRGEVTIVVEGKK